MTLVVGYHTWFEIIVADEVSHIAKLIFKSLLACNHGWTCWVKVLHDVVEFLGTIHSLQIFLPRLTHLVAYAPHNHRGVITVTKHHIGNILMSVIVIERLIIT